MRTFYLSAAIAASLSFSLSSATEAQTTNPANQGAYRTTPSAGGYAAPTASGTRVANPAGAVPSSSANVTAFRIAVIDVSRVFKNHARFKAMMDGMKNQMEAIEQELKVDRDKIKQKEGQRDMQKVGTPDWKRFDNELTQMKGDFNVKMTQRQKDFLEEEASAYHQTYLEVQSAVQYFAQRNGIGLVLRYSGEPIDSNRREEILRVINQPIVFQNSIDITDDIIATVNRGAATPSAVNRTQAAAAPNRQASPRR
ncbi:MAG: OmpH family outer membrane protein [Pirellulales bacterium]|nr:OmpH family outer membrane protein [Pirellulales bacterium]